MKKKSVIMIAIFVLALAALTACGTKTVPVAEPAVVPTAVPTAEPTAEPTPAPTEVPTPEPTATPAPLLKDTIDLSELKDVQPPKDTSWLDEAKDATIYYSAKANNVYSISVRKGPDDFNATLFVVHHGDKIELLAREYGWDFIRTEDNEYGWIAAQYVMVDGESAPDGAAVYIPTQGGNKPATDPSATPSAAPSAEPSTEPSAEPSTEPSTEPSAEPSESPTVTPPPPSGDTELPII